MVARILAVVTLAALSITAPISASAECFTLKPSKGGAELYLIGDQVTVRIERTSNGYDLGIQVDSGLMKSSKRVGVAESESAKLIGTQLGADGLTTEVVKVYLNMGQLVIMAQGKALVRDLTDYSNGGTCMRVRSSAEYFINHVMQESAKFTKTVKLQVTSNETIAAALGL